jgi:hypothetical protein
MSQAPFAFSEPANDTAGLPLCVSLFADRAHVRAQMRDDARACGFAVTGEGAMADFVEGTVMALGDVVMVDCPVVHGAALAALARLDMRVRRSGAHVIVSTSVQALDDVFACMDQSNPQILVDPGRAERVVALGRVLARLSDRNLHELSEEDRLMILRLTEQVGQIAQRLDRLDPPADAPAGPGAANAAFRFEAAKRSFAGEPEDVGERLIRATRPPLPEPRLVRRIIRQRQLRARFFDGDLFADPAWDMMLDLTAARAEHTRVSVTSLCIASGVPPTTALRWIGQMTEAGLFERVEDETDRRRAFIALTDRAAEGMARYFAELGSAAARLV